MSQTACKTLASPNSCFKIASTMDKEALRQSSSSSEETSSDTEEEDEKVFVRHERMQPTNADQAVRSGRQDSESEDDLSEDDESDEASEDEEQSDREDAGKANGTERERGNETSSSDESADRDSDSTAVSGGKPSKRSSQVVDDANVNKGKKALSSEELVKPKSKPKVSPKKSKEKASKRDREEKSVPERNAPKRQKNETSDLASKAIEHLPKVKDFSKANRVKDSILEKSNNSKRSAHASVEKSEDLSSQQNSAKKLEGTLTKKAGERGNNAEKVPRNRGIEVAKGLSSPAKSKLFTGKDEIVLTSEVFRDTLKGFDIPSKKTDEYWSQLAERVDERMEGSWSKEQLLAKLKRMRQRYVSMAEKFKGTGEHKFRNARDEELYAMWDKMWGNGDAIPVDADGVKNKKAQAEANSSPAKAGKAARNKATAPMQNVKVMKLDPEDNKSNGNSSQSEESNDVSEKSPNGRLTDSPMDIGLKDAHTDGNLVPHSVNELQQALQEEIRTTLAEVQKSSKQTLKEWQSKVLAIVEMALKAFADKGRPLTAFDLGDFDESCIPLRNLDLSDSHLNEGDHTLQQQWRELRLKELQVYRQRLELVQKECQLKEERLKALLQRKK